VASGSGSSFGRALIAAIADAAGGSVGVRKSYTATGWHAQISKLTSSDRGYLAAEKAGLSVSRKTLMGWLSSTGADGDPVPSKANQAKIHEAYRAMAGRWPAEIERAQFSIRGVVKSGSDERDRGKDSTAEFLIEGSEGHWDQMRDAWESGEVDPDEFEEWFVEDVVDEDLGEPSEQWEFPGGSYTVTIR
jgi:hypothetical protein